MSILWRRIGITSLEPDPEIGEYLVICSRCGEGFIDIELTGINFPDGRVIFVDERTKKAYLNQNIPKLCGDCGLQEFYDIEQNLLYCPNFTGKIND